MYTYNCLFMKIQQNEYSKPPFGADVVEGGRLSWTTVQLCSRSKEAKGSEHMLNI